MITILILLVLTVASGVAIIVCKATGQSDRDMRIIRQRERLKIH